MVFRVLTNAYPTTHRESRLILKAWKAGYRIASGPPEDRS
jgi:hypothetical protein